MMGEGKIPEPNEERYNTTCNKIEACLCFLPMKKEEEEEGEGGTQTRPNRAQFNDQQTPFPYLLP
ncbi:hypothetical protein Syun_025737 [Stephania yunnanensis]|uniref:Uncharacterized protein n=1 Tax=Stephania yunnanensis TaxID=152371 RepID=A0AAP0EV53_9MAGN